MISKVKHVILSQVPEAEKYGLLQTQLLKSFGQKSVTKQAELLQMVSNPTMGDNLPSDVLLLIRNLSGQSYKDVERAIFLSHLPMPVSTALASSKAATNDQLADEANDVFLEHRVAARSRVRPAVSAVAARPAPAVDGAEIEWIPDPRPKVNTSAVDRPIPPGCCPIHRRWGR